ncbi:MAG: tRNA (adenosine(37)-N6)-dimethylallyltransferase MiaA [Phycisphaerae bacterium]|nr:tRNA (adenosine(37)-N6)-dimethylallyltransferase MiaA [Phycisphaerae bacterium]
MTSPAPILVIVGPTAGGKSALAMELARTLPGECISADSMQIYRGMDIGTAKPTAAERSEIPHHLIDLVEPDDDGFTVDAWLERATATIDEIRRRGRTPIVVGGTNLYVRALLEGLFEGPEPDPALRAALEALPLTALREELCRVDPPSAARIHPNDLRRTVRALEVFRQTGTPLSTLQTQWSADVRQNARQDAIVVGLEWPVESINRRINARVKDMMAAGFLDEVRGLAARGLGRQAREAVGYGELLEHLAGRVSLEDAVEAIKIRTRRYAKQQRTWLRRFRALERSCWLDASVEPMESWPACVRAHLLVHARAPASA